MSAQKPTTAIRVRFARPDEAASLRRLVETSIPHSERWKIFDALAAGELVDDNLISELILVAEDRAESGPCLGVAVAHPPTGALQRAGFRDEELMAAAATVVKLSAVAVRAEHRGGEIGSRLLRRLIAEFRAREYQWMYGQMNAASPRLSMFYRRLGFDVLELGKDLELPFGIWPAAKGEQWFWQEL